MKTTQAEHDAAVSAEHRRVNDETYERYVAECRRGGWIAAFACATGAAAHAAKRASDSLAVRLLRESLAG